MFHILYVKRFGHSFIAIFIVIYAIAVAKMDEFSTFLEPCNVQGVATFARDNDKIFCTSMELNM